METHIARVGPNPTNGLIKHGIRYVREVQVRHILGRQDERSARVHNGTPRDLGRLVPPELALDMDACVLQFPELRTREE
jgi:hypothetical protein